MRTLAKSALALLSISLTMAALDKGFKAGTPDQYSHQENGKVLIGSKAFDTDELTGPVFGKKADLNRYGILPILVVIRNNRGQTLDLNGLEVKLTARGSHSVAPLEPQEVAAIAIPAKEPKMSKSPLPRRPKKNPLSGLEIVEHSFSARMLPAGEEASGFFYFRTRPQPGMQLLIDGIFERPSGKEILYFEIPL
jgi:hypothetical protein